MAMLENQQGWVPFEDNRECSKRLCTLYCPQWCYVLFPPPPFSIDDDDSSGTSFSPLAIAIIGILATAFILISYYTVVAKYCGSSYRRRWRHSNNRPEEEESPGDPHNRESWRLAPSDGLDEALIRRIEVRKYRIGERLGSDCSVCLAEFQENESLRLLPKCSHAFHLHCIDAWLKYHSNCPLCRTNIVFQSPVLENRAPPGSDHEQETLVIVIEGPDLEGSGVETGEEEEEDREVGSDGNLFKNFEVNEIGEEDGKLSGRYFSLGSAFQSCVFPISDVLKVNLEEECIVDGGSGSTSRGGGGDKSKLRKGRRSMGLHRVMRPVRMKRSVSIGRSSFARQGKPVKKLVFSLPRRRAEESSMNKKEAFAWGLSQTVDHCQYINFNGG